MASVVHSDEDMVLAEYCGSLVFKSLPDVIRKFRSNGLFISDLRCFAYRQMALMNLILEPVKK